MASKVQVADVPAGGSEPKGKAGPPPSKSDFPATPAQSAEKVQQEKLGDAAKLGQPESTKLGAKPNELRESDGKPITSADAANIAGKAAGAGSPAARPQSAAAASEKSQQTSKPSANGSSKGDAPEALSDKPGERQGDKKRDVTEPKVHYYKEKESKEGGEGGLSYASALKRPKEEVQAERQEELAETENGIRKWLIPGAVAVLVVGVAIVVVSAFSKNKQHSSR